MILTPRCCQPSRRARRAAKMNEATDRRSNRIQASPDSIGSIAAHTAKIKAEPARFEVGDAFHQLKRSIQRRSE